MQILLGHTKLESTIRYLGIDVDDALAVQSVAVRKLTTTYGLRSY